MQRKHKSYDWYVTYLGTKYITDYFLKQVFCNL